MGFLILSAVAISVYIVGGIVYNKKKGDGSYSHPHSSNWAEFATLTKEGAVLSKNWAAEKWNSRHGSAATAAEPRGGMSAKNTGHNVDITGPAENPNLGNGVD